MSNILACDGNYILDNKGRISCDGDLSTLTEEDFTGFSNLVESLDSFAQFMTFDSEVAGYISAAVLLFWFSGYATGNIVARLRR